MNQIQSNLNFSAYFLPFLHLELPLHYIVKPHISHCKKRQEEIEDKFSKLI